MAFQFGNMVINRLNSIVVFSNRWNDYVSGSVSWLFLSVHNWGENPLGDWTLYLEDRYQYGGNTQAI